jgi:hypothetical protein
MRAFARAKAKWKCPTRAVVEFATHIFRILSDATGEIVRMAMDIDLIPQNTRVVENGTAEGVDIRLSQTRTFFCHLVISDQIEQESIDVSIWGSPDGQGWGTQPVLKLQQQFYKGETRALLDLTMVPEVNFIRGSWDLNRWGRVAPEPMFVIGLHLSEVPAMPGRIPQTQGVSTT